MNPTETHGGSSRRGKLCQFVRIRATGEALDVGLAQIVGQRELRKNDEIRVHFLGRP